MVVAGGHKDCSLVCERKTILQFVLVLERYVQYSATFLVFSSLSCGHEENQWSSPFCRGMPAPAAKSRPAPASRNAAEKTFGSDNGGVILGPKTLQSCLSRLLGLLNRGSVQYLHSNT